jgi:hypothetical protein
MNKRWSVPKVKQQVDEQDKVMGGERAPPPLPFPFSRPSLLQRTFERVDGGQRNVLTAPYFLHIFLAGRRVEGGRKERERERERIKGKKRRGRKRRRGREMDGATHAE